jgi:hypothetical protein
MKREELDTLWFQAMRQSIEEGEDFIRYHFAALVADHEREACARVCDGVSKDPFTKVGGKHAPYMEATAKDCADTIRARGVPR